MKFLVDAHLPRSLCAVLSARGHEALHTFDLLVITKDTDFFYSHLLQGRPWKLLLIRTGNISTRDLKALLERNLPLIEAAIQNHTLVELDRVAVTAVA